MTLSDISIRRPVFTAMMSFALLVVGILSFFRLPTDLYPPVNFPILLVRVVYPGASPQDIERDVTKPLEDAVAGIPGLTIRNGRSDHDLRHQLARRGYRLADGAILLSTNASSGNGVVSCLSPNYAHRWSVELLATGWNVLATSSAAVLLGNSTAVSGFQGLVLLDRGNGAVLRSHFYAAAASSLVQAQFANDGLRFVLATQSVSTRFVYAPSASEPLRAYEVSTLTPIPARTLSHDAATDQIGRAHV